jgi:hypothetical protein
METTKEAYEQKMAAQLDEWGARIDALEARANKLDAPAKHAMNQEAVELSKLRDVAQRTFDELKAASADTWKTIENSVEVKWSQLGIAMDEFWSRLS